MRWAVSPSTGRLSATMPPKAETGSPRRASSNAAARSLRSASPQRDGVLDDGHGRLGKPAHGVPGGVGVEEIVERQLLARQLFSFAFCSSSPARSCR